MWESVSLRKTARSHQLGARSNPPSHDKSNSNLSSRLGGRGRGVRALLELVSGRESGDQLFQKVQGPKCPRGRQGITHLVCDHQWKGPGQRATTSYTDTAESDGCWRRRRMSSKIQKRADAWTDFTAGNHLWVQQQINRRAYLLWLAGGCLDGNGLNDWLRTEREVLTEFCLACEKRSSVRTTSSPERKIKATRSTLPEAILNTRQNFQARKPIVEATTPANSL